MNSLAQTCSARSLGHASGRCFQQIPSSFDAALTEAVHTGEIPKSTDTSAHAYHLTATILGIYVLIRAAASPEAISGAPTSAIDYVEALGKTRAKDRTNQGPGVVDPTS